MEDPNHIALTDEEYGAMASETADAILKAMSRKLKQEADKRGALLNQTIDASAIVAGNVGALISFMHGCGMEPLSIRAEIDAQLDILLTQIPLNLETVGNA